MTKHKRTGPKPKQAAGERFYFLKHGLPYLAFIFGLLASIAAAIALPSAIQNVKHDDLVRSEGITVSGEIDYVMKEHHSSQRSSWDEYAPVVHYQAEGAARTKPFQIYSSKSALAYRVGQEVDVTYLSGKPYDSILAIPTARKELDANLRQAVGFAVAGGILLAYGAPIQTVRIVAWARKRKATKKRGKRA